MNYQQGHVQGASSIPKRPSQQSGQQLSNTTWPVVPPKRLMSLSTQDIDEPESPMVLATQDTDEPEPVEPLATQDIDELESPMTLATQDIDTPEPLVPLAMSETSQSYDVDKRSSLAEMATTRLEAAEYSEMHQSNTPLVWKKIKVSYTATVNVRRTKKRVF